MVSVITLQEIYFKCRTKYLNKLGYLYSNLQGQTINVVEFDMENEKNQERKGTEDTLLHEIVI